MTDPFDEAWEMTKNEDKGKFTGYSRNTISGRAERQAKARAWNKSRKNKRAKTQRRYSRNKSRGNVRPTMRRQLGAGGSRKHIAKASEEELSVAVLAPERPNMSAKQKELMSMELFSGVGGEKVVPGGWGSDMYRRGHTAATSDWGKKEGPDSKQMGITPTFLSDIQDLSVNEIEDHFGGRMPDVLFGSPTCVDMSTTNVKSKWHQPEGYGKTGSAKNKAAKAEALEARGTTNEPPKWMGESTDENPAGNWKPKMGHWIKQEGKSGLKNVGEGANRGSAKLFRDTWKLAEEMTRRNPDMFTILENPTGMARYMPMTYSKILPDFASVNHASYSDPVASLFGIAQNRSPLTGTGLDPLETSIKYGGNTDEQLRYGAANLPPLKRTDFFGRFPKGWVPRPRVGQISEDPKDDILYGTQAKYNDFSSNPLFRRKVPAPKTFLDEILLEGMRKFGKRGLKTNSLKRQPRDEILDSFQFGNPEGKVERMGGILSGSGYAFAPAGSNRGTQQTRGFSYINPKTGKKVRVPAYHAKSIIPFQMGTDFGRAVEESLGALPPVQPETAFHLENPNHNVQRFLDKGGVTTIDQLSNIVHPDTTRYLQERGHL